MCPRRASQACYDSDEIIPRLSLLGVDSFAFTVVVRFMPNMWRSTYSTQFSVTLPSSSYRYCSGMESSVCSLHLVYIC